MMKREMKESRNYTHEAQPTCEPVELNEKVTVIDKLNDVTNALHEALSRTNSINRLVYGDNFDDLNIEEPYSIQEKVNYICYLIDKINENLSYTLKGL